MGTLSLALTLSFTKRGRERDGSVGEHGHIHTLSLSLSPSISHTHTHTQTHTHSLHSWRGWAHTVSHTHTITNTHTHTDGALESMGMVSVDENTLMLHPATLTASPCNTCCNTLQHTDDEVGEHWGH